MMDKISNNSNPLARLGRAEASRKPKPALGNPQESDPAFAENLAGANAQAVAPAPAQVVPAAMPKGASSGEEALQAPLQSLQSMEAKRIGPHGPSALFDRPGHGAEASPLSLPAAVSMNTAAAIAGPKPWGKEWVFAGYDRNPDIKPLIPEKTPTAAQLLQEAGAREGGEAAGAKSKGLLQAMQELAKVEGAIGTARLAGENPEASPAVARDGNGMASEAQALASQREQTQISQALASETHDLGDASDSGMEGAELLEARSLAAHKPVRTAGPVANASLSGGEFVSTLAALRGGQQARHESLQGQMGGESQQGREGGLAMASTKLKMIDGGLKGRAKGGFDENLALSGAPAGLGAAHGGNPANGIASMAPEVAGHVVKGAGSRDRLSSESLMNITQSVRNLTPNGGGEMRVRLRPDNLGELHVKVVTEGNRVGLQIQASDEHARKVLEESISHLKTSLAAQHLTLSQVDVTVAHPSQTASGGDFRQEGQAQSQNAFGDLFNQNRNPDSSGEGWTRQGGESVWRDPGAGAARGASSLRAAQAWGSDSLVAGSRRAVGDSGRLDVMA